MTTITLPTLWAEHPQIPLLLKDIENTKKLLEQKEAGLEMLIEEIQSTCQHENCDSETKHGAKVTILLSKKCLDCGFVFTKPDGGPYKVCERCWSAMKHSYAQPGQGERTFFYECTVCKYVDYHT